MFGPPRVTKGVDTSITSIAVGREILISVSVTKAEFLKNLLSTIVYHFIITSVNFL